MSDLWRDRDLREQTLRFGAERLCLWVLCSKRRCKRANACHGDPRICTHIMVEWMAAFEAERRERPDFAAMESQIETAAELRAYRAWRAALKNAF
ncbi:MAG: hypothetical protein R3D30_02820 [Hyphomicrobiales bacterium]